jgi:hypothetical protein
VPVPAGATLGTLPTGCAAAGATVTCSLGNLAAGRAVTRVLTLQLRLSGPLVSSGTVAAGERDTSAADNAAAATTLVLGVLSGDGNGDG